MDEAMVGWLFLLFMLVWRSVTNYRCVERCIHACGPLAPLLQWYTLTFAGLLFLLVRSFFDIALFDYYIFHFLDPAKVSVKINNICTGEGLDQQDCDALRDELKMPHWLHKLSLGAPVAGLLAFFSLSILLFRFIKFNHARKVEEGSDLPWKLAQRLEWVIIIIGMPLIFVVMSMRSLIRIWAVMTGSGWHPGQDWDRIQRLELATYSMDLELAVAFQFYAVMMFGFLCTSFLEYSKYVNMPSSQNAQAESRRYMRTLAYTAVQGVYAFVFVGVLRTIFDITVTYLQEQPKYKDQAAMIEDKFIAKVGIVFTFVTLLCMLNMVLISKIADIKDHLGNANLKFLGTRLLLLIAQIQPQVLNGLTVGAPLYLTVRDHVAKYHLEEYFDRWTFTTNQAKLAHAAALNYECLLVSFVTILFWLLKEEQKQALMFDASTTAGSTSTAVAAREKNEGYQRLLDA
mmetsp:Transcript_38936/g.70261  ORF Transcript_38936/g.70261 Transcript_38936/m.70261 type:complete len:458 (-) Transcript_38936:74-1447(-)